MSICYHVYENTGYDICPSCGNDTHEIDWVEQNLRHKEWIESGKATTTGVWWSI